MARRSNNGSKNKLYKLVKVYDEILSQKEELARKSPDVKRYIEFTKELEELEKEIKQISLDLAKDAGPFKLESGNVSLLVGERYAVDIEKLSFILNQHDIDLYSIDGLVEVIYRVTVEKLKQFIKANILPKDSLDSLVLSGYFTTLKKN